jgi:hypothetical protein
MEKEKLDKLTAALDCAGYEMIQFQMEEYTSAEMPDAIGKEERRLTGNVSLRIRPATPMGK